MRTVTALFDTYDQAASAVRTVRDAGIPSADISLVANNVAGDVPDDVTDAKTARPPAPAWVPSRVAVPACSPASAPSSSRASVRSWPAAGCSPPRSALSRAPAAGGAAGGLLGALANAGVLEGEAHIYAEGIRRGGTLVSVRVDDDRAETIAAILHNANGVDIDARKSDYLAEGWHGFDEDAPAYSEAQIRDYRSSYGTTVPPIV